MSRRKLTARTVLSLPADPAGQRDYWDESLRNFGLRVAPSGRKTWNVMYRYNGRLRRLSLGTFPPLGLADAREEARKALRRVAAGYDPAAEKRAARHADTFAELADEYLRRHAKLRKKSWAEDERVINKELLPHWRHSRPSDISRADVRALLESIADRGAPVGANRTHALISKIFNFGIEREWVTANPCHLLKRPGVEKKRDRVLTDEEIRRLWKGLDALDIPMRAMFKLRLLTAQRGGEIRLMRWEHVDLDKGWWTIPSANAKNEKTHRVPLNATALQILKDLKTWQADRLVKINEGRAKKRLPLRAPGGWVFPYRFTSEPMSYTQRATNRLREASHVSFRPHDLRRTAATMMASNKTPRLTIAKILNHADDDVTAIYERYGYDEEKRTALEAWDRLLKSILDDKPSGSSVVPFTQAS